MPIATKKETPLMRLGRQRIAWNVAVSCLALAVKVDMFLVFDISIFFLWND